jgi:hypothetical protein
MLNLVGAHYHNVIFYENYIVSNIYWLLTLTMFESVALLPSSDSRSCTVGMADFNCWLVRPPRLQQKVCFFFTLRSWRSIQNYVFIGLLHCYELLELILCNPYSTDLYQTSGLELWYSVEFCLADLHHDRYNQPSCATMFFSIKFWSVW